MAHSTRSKSPVQRRPPATRVRRRLENLAEAHAAPSAKIAGDATASRAPTLPGGIGTIGGALTWLSGATAGIAAVFYATGYLASFAYVRMLGVPLASLHYDYTFYVQRGAVFFAWLVVETAPYLFLVSALCLLVLFAAAGLRRLRNPLSQRLRGILGRRPNWQAIAYGGLLLLLAFQISTHLRYPEALAVTDVLHNVAANNSVPDVIREMILSGNERLLRGQFVYLANQEIWIGALLVLAWAVSRGGSWRVLRIAPFGLVLVTSTVYLALEYGTLALPVTFQKASIPAEGPSTPVYLLNQIETGYVFWDCRERQARWVPTATTRVILSEKQTLRQILSSCQSAEP